MGMEIEQNASNLGSQLIVTHPSEERALSLTLRGAIGALRRQFNPELPPVTDVQMVDTALPLETSSRGRRFLSRTRHEIRSAITELREAHASSLEVGITGSTPVEEVRSESLTRYEETEYPFPRGVRLESPPAYPEFPIPPVPKDPLWRRKVRTEEPTAYKERILDKPWWTLASIGFGGIKKRARSIGQHPERNSTRVEEALSEELHQVALTNTELLTNNIFVRIKNFLVHRGLHIITSEVAKIATAVSVPIIGRALSWGYSTVFEGSPEMLVPNMFMLIPDTIIDTLVGLEAVGLGPFSPLAIIPTETVNVLFNMYVNASLGRRNSEVNNQVIPHLYQIVQDAVARMPQSPELADKRVITIVETLNKIYRHKPKLLTRLPEEEWRLNPKNPNSIGSKKRREEIDELKLIGRTLDILEIQQYHDATTQEWWNIGKRMLRWRRKGDINHFRHLFEDRDEYIYLHFDLPYSEARRMKYMWDIAQRVNTNITGSPIPQS